MRADSTVPPVRALLARGVEIRGVTKHLGGALIIDSLSLDVAAGSVTVLLGPSGSGKSTLLRLIAGLERLDGGTLHIGGDLVAGDSAWVSPERRHVGMVFQDWALFPHLSVGANIAFGVPRAERSPERLAEALGLVGLDGMEDRLPHTLSGGQQQRVALARALAPRPDVLLLDEPFSNLDASLRRRLRTEVHELLDSLGVTTIFVTHDQEEAFVLGEHVAVMRAGRIVQHGTPAELYRHPADRWIAGFVGEVNLLAGVAVGPIARTSLGDAPLVAYAEGKVDVVVRPEQLRLQPGGDATVELVEYHGHDATARVRLADGIVLKLRATELQVRRGDPVTVSFVLDAAPAFPVV
jgi:iron(III) transport system ATP-binding protein